MHNKSDEKRFVEFIQDLGYYPEDTFSWGDFLNIMKKITGVTDLPFIVKTSSDKNQLNLKINTTIDFFTLLYLQCPSKNCNYSVYITPQEIITNMIKYDKKWCPNCIRKISQELKESKEKLKEKVYSNNDVEISDVNAPLKGYIGYNNKTKEAVFVEDENVDFLSDKKYTNENLVVEVEKGYLENPDDESTFIPGKRNPNTTKRLPRIKKDPNIKNQKLPLVEKIMNESESNFDDDKPVFLSKEDRKEMSFEKRREFFKKLNHSNQNNTKNNMSVNQIKNDLTPPLSKEIKADNEYVVDEIEHIITPEENYDDSDVVSIEVEKGTRDPNTGRKLPNINGVTPIPREF